jgi:hypothetical protein
MKRLAVAGVFCAGTRFDERSSLTSALASASGSPEKPRTGFVVNARNDVRLDVATGADQVRDDRVEGIGICEQRRNVVPLGRLSIDTMKALIFSPPNATCQALAIASAPASLQLLPVACTRLLGEVVAHCPATVLGNSSCSPVSPSHGTAATKVVSRR